MDELIVCVAPYPGEKQTERFEGRLDVPEEALRSHRAGASIVHLHVRNEEGIQTLDVTRFQRDVEKIRSTCPVVVEGSTGGTPENTLQERSISLTVPGIEMGSLNVGSVNLFGGVYQNPMSDIRFYAREMKHRGIRPFLVLFDLSMFHNADRLVREGLLAPPCVYNFVLDMPDALPFSLKALDVFLDFLPKGSPWFLTRHHSLGWKGFREALERGGHVRVGYEDGPFLSSGKKARTNAELVEEVVEAARSLGRKAVGPDRAREILGISV